MRTSLPGGAAITCAFPNLPKFLDNPDNKDSKIVGKIRTGLSPGRIVNGKLIRRAVWWPSIGHGVAANTKYPEAVYLFMQWSTSSQIYSWMTSNPGGYYDPVHVSDFKDPTVISSYHAYHIPVYIDTIKHSGLPSTSLV